MVDGRGFGLPFTMRDLAACLPEDTHEDTVVPEVARETVQDGLSRQAPLASLNRTYHRPFLPRPLHRAPPRRPGREGRRRRAQADPLDETVKLVRDAGGTAAAARADVRDAAAVKAAFDAVVRIVLHGTFHADAPV